MEEKEQNKSKDYDQNLRNERSLKEVLKEADYKKILPIVEAIDYHGSVTLAEAKKLCGKLDVTT